MKSILRIIRFLLLISPNLQYTFAQSVRVSDSTILKWKIYYELLYGSDYNLLNGRRYINLYPTADGHPFLGDNRFYSAMIVINYKTYRGVEIKYDICNQKVLLQYPYFTGNKDIIILNEQFIDEFEINGRLFRKYTFPGIIPRFYQVVSQGDIWCLYHWKKVLIKGLTARSFFQYSSENHLSYLVLDNILSPFSNRKSFLKLLPQKYNKNIKLYLKSNNIFIRDASDIQMKSLMDFCNKLISQN